MYPVPLNETLIETKACRSCGTPFPITDKDLEFHDKVSPSFAGKKYKIPTPTLCPDCRQQRRMTFRKERGFYKRKCDATGADIVSIYAPQAVSLSGASDRQFTIYDRNYWLGDQWDPMEYGRDFDFSRPFFEQFFELSVSVPRPAVHQEAGNENSVYTNETEGSKDCYLMFDAAGNDNVLYSNWIGNSRSTVDCAYSFEMDGSYECIGCNDSYELRYSHNSQKCTNSWFLYDCVGCEYCIGCVGMRNVKYHVFNKPVSPEEFRRIEAECHYRRGSVFPETMTLLRNFPRVATIVYRSENVFGSNIVGSSELTYCFDALGCKNSKYIYDIWDSERVMDYYEGWNHPSYSYEGETSGGTFRGIFVQRCVSCQDITYCSFLRTCKNCFGCVWLHNRSYCIFNKQYTKEEYESLVPRIIEHMMKTREWWEFFPWYLSPFWYNETTAQEHHPLTRDEVLKNGIFNWSDYEAPFPKVEKIIPASRLPDDIAQIPDDILGWAIECEVTRKPFRIIKPELEFYRKHNLPVPRKHPDQRHLDRLAQRNPRKLFERKCDCCHKDMITTYAPERPERVYCEECYGREVVQ